MHFIITKPLSVPETLKPGIPFSVHVKFPELALDPDEKYVAPSDGDQYYLSDLSTIVELVKAKNLQRRDYKFELITIGSKKSVDSNLLNAGKTLICL